MAYFKGYAHATALWDTDKDKASPMLVSVANYCYEIDCDRDVFFSAFVDADVLVNCDGKVDGRRVCTLKRNTDDKPFLVKVLDIVDATDHRDTGLSETDCDRIADKMLSTRDLPTHRRDEEQAGYIA